jgi:hypothetical protein
MSHLATFVFLAMKTSATRTEEEDALLHRLYARRRDFIPEILASQNGPALMGDWQLAEANYEHQYPNKCETPEEQASLLSAEAADE